MRALPVGTGAVAAALLVGIAALGCNAILGLSPGVLSDGGLGMPCDLGSNTPCDDELACVIGICRPPCASDSDCPSTERCLVEDGTPGTDCPMGNCSQGAEGAVYGCVPTDTPCSDLCQGGQQFVETQGRTCDGDGQCRNACAGGVSYCTSDQTCESVGGALACLP